MHWTAFLAYRRIPPNVMVVGDVGCNHCGYNLRGLRALGNCPECGNRVSDSLFLLAKPALVAQNLRSYANSYFTLTILIVGCLGTMVGWPLTVTAVVLSMGTTYRAWCAGALYYRGELRNSETIHTRAFCLWIMSLVEWAIALGWTTAVLMINNNLSLQTSANSLWLIFGFEVWLASMLLSGAVASWFGNALAGLLGYGWMVMEMRLLLGALIATIVTLALFMASSVMRLTLAAALFFLVVAGLLVFFAVSFAWFGLQHLANAAEQAAETLDEVLDGDRVAIVPESQRAEGR